MCSHLKYPQKLISFDELVTIISFELVTII
jgi:hypothetical protein